MQIVLPGADKWFQIKVIMFQNNYSTVLKYVQRNGAWGWVLR